MKNGTNTYKLSKELFALEGRLNVCKMWSNSIQMNQILNNLTFDSQKKLEFDSWRLISLIDCLSVFAGPEEKIQ